MLLDHLILTSKSSCPGGIVVAERDGHAIARISPVATFGECLGHETIMNYMQECRSWDDPAI